ncbi:hypothetical protein ACHQM5_001017 [Ranunculus cassubicifolius]
MVVDFIFQLLHLCLFALTKATIQVGAKPFVESVLSGYNGTVMAYGQVGTGKTFTLRETGDENPRDRGIMVRSMEHILANISPHGDSVSVSYVQLYLETIIHLLNPKIDNI